ncbi:mediator of RNA polymerase II transcription subunit 17 [Gigaspora margarita]|uniref:Mediator of RNA polymerase II transcription subunit 17 n=1 Tax=Gigaspora margarita TaxID=4874 RepID=A0A8H4AFN5_GIGMA|nr:mediator of RNA polymerase II transcription subunit 17 [Gigaspora margarita]
MYRIKIINGSFIMRCVLNWTRDTPRESSGAQILNQVIHLLKYYFFCKHTRDIVIATRALNSDGVPVQIHFISDLAKGKDLIEDIWKKIKFSFFSGFLTQPFHFKITNVSDSSSASCDIRIRGHAQFQNLVSRELILLLLRIIHEQLIYLTESSDEEVTQDKWSKYFWRRPIKISIVNGQPLSES